MAVPGTMGKILLVDLATQEISVETPSDDVYLEVPRRLRLGGLLPLSGCRSRASIPWGRRTILGFFTGLLTGTPGDHGQPLLRRGQEPEDGHVGRRQLGRQASARP